MNASDLREQAIDDVRKHLPSDRPNDPRVVHCEQEADWSPVLLRNVSDHQLHVLARASDIVVFFDRQGREIGWRDDGRLGVAQPMMVDADKLLASVVGELDLPANTRLGRVVPRELPPLGWSQEAVLFLSGISGKADVLRVWVNPETLRVIQWLFGRTNPGGEDQ